MALTQVEGLPGAPWDRPLKGTLDRVVVESELLAGNPLGDPERRPLYIYVPKGASGALPTVYLIQGLTGQLDMWLNRRAFEPNIVERIDSAISGGDCPPCLVVFVDAWTSYGGSQFINSIATGPYMDYLCDEVVPWIDAHYPTTPSRDARGLTGHSSGGYGAMVVPMLRPDVFGALASSAGDALFEVCYLPGFRETVRMLRDKFEGSYEVFWERFRSGDHVDTDRFGPMNDYAMAACYSPDPANPGSALLPFDVGSGKLIPEIWEQWLGWDPVRLAAKHADDLRSMKLIHVDGGRSDEWFLELGARAFADAVEEMGIECNYELFDGTHSGLTYRYPKHVKMLAEALTA
ncbi:MAG TPA: alpha/beta hydrolase-fold protein [Actinomycetota bacterium]|nr:alpha/beta hydrolase-fold protein [Actinomycetota bacterium]